MPGAAPDPTDGGRPARDAAVRRTLLAAGVGGAVTVVVAALPSVRLAYRSPDGHLVLETVMAMIGAFVALLVYGRFRRSLALQDLLVVHALGIMAVASLFFVTGPMSIGASPESPIASWAPMVVRLVAAGLLLAGALAGSRQVPAGAHGARDTVVTVLLLAGLAVTVQLLAAYLPTAVTTFAPPEDSGRPRFEGHPAVLAAQGLILVCFAVAAFVLTRQARATRDELTGWLAAACAVGAWSRVNYLLFPSLYSTWLYTGDLLRLGFYALLLVGALREVRTYWAAQAVAAVAAERARLSRDLHDGAVQEMGYILQQTGGHALDAATSERVRAAAERALAEARRAVAALAAPVDQSLAEAVREAVIEVGDRYDVPVTLVDGQATSAADAPLPAEHREALVRIAREATANAARHACASQVTVSLGPGSLSVTDDGSGFDPSRVPAGRFGLVSMRDRAEGLDGSLTLTTAPGTGTAVEVRW